MLDYTFYDDYGAGGMETAAPGVVAWNDSRLDSILRNMSTLKPCGSTGLDSLDRILGGGLYPEVYVLAAEPGAGKTTLALQIADYVATFGNRKVLYISAEMAAAQIVAKSLSRIIAEARQFQPLSVREVMRMDERNYEAIQQAVNAYGSVTAPNIATIDERITVDGIAGIYAALSAYETLLPLLVIDYLQIMPREERADGKTETDYQHHTANMRALCGIANRYRVPVLVISSQNRSASNKGSLDSLAGSGEIGYGAANVLMLAVDGASKEEQEENQAKEARPVVLSVKKNRFGACGKLSLVFQAKENRFLE